MSVHAVIGLDLSLTCTGMAVAYDDQRIHTRVIKTPPGHSLSATSGRIITIHDAVNDLLSDARIIARDVEIDMAVLEAPSFGSSNGKGHERAGLWWNVYFLLQRWDIPVVAIAPSTRAKYITGNGRADKKLVKEASRERYPHIILKTDDECDALGLASMAARHQGYALEDDISPLSLNAFDGVKPHIWEGK